ncbi:MAG: hypothetical protein H7A49_06945 [Akkermansiaceae bacterium]|nr:hypothetical protein [Akkermansiaceae bacterium]MCP5543630.1 hypothetical protein [Akkermansiaceae bacterium]MCP5547291.1 hypothetical protein [Akkermansiaceae bacterium]
MGIAASSVEIRVVRTGIASWTPRSNGSSSAGPGSAAARLRNHSSSAVATFPSVDPATGGGSLRSL